MQENVGDVKDRRRETCELVLDPEGRVDQRIVLGRRAEIEPDAPQAIEVAQGFVVLDVIVVVPDEVSADGRPVSHERGCEQHGQP